MTTLTVFMEGILSRESFPLGLVLMALSAQLAAGLALLPGMVAFRAIDLQRFGMLFVGECNLPIRHIKDDLIFRGKSSGNKQ